MATVGPVVGTGISFNQIAQTLGNITGTAENNLRGRIEALSQKPPEQVSQTDLLMMQADLQKWSMLIDLQSTVTKTLSDALKGIIQKSS